MNRKIIGIIIVLFGVALIAGFAYFFFSGRDLASLFGSSRGEQEGMPVDAVDPAAKAPEPENQAGGARRINAVDPAAESQTAGIADKAPQSRSFGKEDLKRLASSFAERFGTYSNQSNFSNVLDLKIFMTRKMQVWADSFVAENRAVPQAADIYYGITTRAVAEEIAEFDDDLGLASVSVKTRRQEARSSRNNVSDVFEQSIEVSLKKENGAWKVDQALWQAR